MYRLKDLFKISVKAVALLLVFCMLSTTLYNFTFAADAADLEGNMVSYTVNIDGKTNSVKKTGETSSVWIKLNTSNVNEVTFGEIELILKLSGNTDLLEFSFPELDESKVGIERLLSVGNDSFVKLTFKSHTAGSSSVNNAYFNIKFKNGITNNNEQIVISTQSVTYKGNEVSETIVPRAGDVSLTSVAEYFEYDIENKANTNITYVTNTVLRDVSLGLKVYNIKNINDYGCIQTSEIKINNTIRLPVYTTFASESSVMLQDVDLLAAGALGRTVTTQSGNTTYTWEITDIATSGNETDGESLSYELTLVNPDPSKPINITEANFAIILSGLKNTNAQAGNTYYIESTATVDSKDWFGNSQEQKTDTAQIQVKIYDSENGQETGEESEAYLEKHKYGFKSGTVLDEESEVIKYKQGEKTELYFRFSQFGNYQSGTIQELVLTEYADKNSGYDPQWLKPQYVYPGVFCDENQNLIAVKYKINVVLNDGTAATMQEGMTGTDDQTGYNKAVSIQNVDFNKIQKIQIIYYDIPAGTKVISDTYSAISTKQYQAGICFDVIQHPEIENVYTISNRVYLDYKYDLNGQMIETPYTKEASRWDSASILYQGDRGLAIGTGKGGLNIEKVPGFYSGNYIEYTLTVRNYSTSIMSNFELIDNIQNEIISEVGAGETRPVGIFMMPNMGSLEDSVFMNSQFFNVDSVGNITTNRSTGYYVKAYSLMENDGYAYLSIEKSGVNDEYNVMTLSDETLSALVTKNKSITSNDSYYVTDANGNISLPPNYVMYIKYLVKIDDNLSGYKTIENKYDLYIEGDGEGGGSWETEKGVTIDVNKSNIPLLYINKYYESADSTVREYMVNRRDIIGDGKSLAYYIEGEFNKMYGATYTDQVKSLYIMEAVHSSFMTSNAIKYDPSYELNYAITEWEIRDKNNNLLNKDNYEFIVKNIQTLSPTNGTNIYNVKETSMADAKNILMELKAKDGSGIPEGLKIKLKLEFYDLNDKLFGDVKSVSISNSAYITAAHEDGLFTEFAYKLTNTTGYEYSRTVYGSEKTDSGIVTFPGLRDIFTVNYTLSDENAIGISKKVIGINGSTDGANQVEIPGNDIITYEIKLVNKGLAIGNKTYPLSLSDLLPPGQTFIQGSFEMSYDGINFIPITANTTIIAPVGEKTIVMGTGLPDRQRISVSVCLEANTTYYLRYNTQVAAADDALLNNTQVAKYDNEVVLDAYKTKTLYKENGVDVGARYADYVGEAKAFMEYIFRKISRTSDSIANVEYHYSGTAAFYAKAEIEYVSQKIRPGIEKSMNSTTDSSGYVSTSQIIEWGIRVHNESPVSLEDYYIYDILPRSLEIYDNKGSVSSDYRYPDGIINDFNENGDTLVYWYVDEAISSGEEYYLTYQTKAGASIEPRSYVNYAYLVPTQDFVQIMIDEENQKTVGSKIKDILHETQFTGSNKELLPTEQIKAVRAEDDVLYFIEGAITSYKEVENTKGYKAGSLGVVYSEAGDKVYYTLTLYNPLTDGGKTMDNLTIMDILPMVGDQGVYTDQLRKSEFAVTDIANINVYKINSLNVIENISIDDYDVYLSDKGYGDFGQTNLGVKGLWDISNDVNALWKNTNSLAGSNSVLIVFNSDFTLALGETVRVVFEASLPSVGVMNDQIAWNSFAYRYGETGASNGELTINEPPKVGVRIENPVIEVITVEGTKTWSDNNNYYGMRPDDLILTLYANGEILTGITPVWSDTNTNTWTYKYENLPKYIDGQLVTYTVTETVPDNYEKTADDGRNFTNTYKDEKVTVEGTKTWLDNNDEYGIRPDTLILTLSANGEVFTATPVWTDTDTNIWTYKYENLPKYIDGQLVTYTVTETVPDNYEKTADDGRNFTNTYKDEKVTVEGTKTWSDSGNYYGMRPATLTLTLKANGVVVAGAVPAWTNTDTNIWTYKYENLPKYIDGEPAEYTVEETVPDNYEKTADDGRNFTNTYKDEKVTVEGTKTWSDNNNYYGMRPSALTLTLRTNGEIFTAEPIWTNTDTNIWTYKYENLPKYIDGELAVYTVEETVPNNYEKTADDGRNFTNTYKDEKVTVEGTKTWSDNNNYYGMRPAALTLTLKANGVVVADAVPVWTNTSANIWTYKYENLPKYIDGELAEYTVEETVPDNYEKTADDGRNFTNTYMNERVTVEGTKTWSDNNNYYGMRPDALILTLKANGVVVADVIPVWTNTDTDVWTYKYENLPKYVNGELAEYTVEETVPDSYVKTADDGRHFTNTYMDERVTVEGTKTWEDESNNYGMRPAALTLTLRANGEIFTAEPVWTNTSADIWTYKYENLPKYINGELVAYTVTETVPDNYEKTADDGRNFTNTYKDERVNVEGTKTWEDESNNYGMRPAILILTLRANGEIFTAEPVWTNTTTNIWTYKYENLPKYIDGQLVTYTVTETVPDNYDKTADDGRNFTNTYKDEKLTVEGTKTWADNNDEHGMRPAALTLILRANGEVFTAEPVWTNTTTNIWTYKYENLPKYIDGQLVTYTVTETVPDNYEKTADDGRNFTNAYKYEKVTVEGTKTWSDNNNYYGMRPATLTLTLKANGVVVAGAVPAWTNTDTNVWMYKYENLPKYIDGQLAEYTVEETVPDNYEKTADDGRNFTNTYMDEKVTVEGTKTWSDNNNYYGMRPNTLTLTLRANGEVFTAEPVWTNTDTNIWTYKYENLPKYIDGELAEYTVEETVPDNYEKTADDGRNFTNTYRDEKVIVEGTKTWEDESNKYGMRPDILTLTLRANGEIFTAIPVWTNTTTNIWTYKYENLPKYIDGELAEYTVEETAPDNYEKISDDGRNFTNKYNDEKVNISGSKIWSDDNNRDNIRFTTEAFKGNLKLWKKIGTSNPVEVSLNEYTLIVETTGDSNRWTFRVEGLPKYENRSIVEYSFTEESISGYTQSKGTGANDFINTHIIEKTEYTVNKVWSDDNNRDGIRPVSVTVQLRANNVNYGDPVQITGENPSYTWNDLPKNENGEAVTYTAVEVNVPAGYSDSYVTAEGSTTITNTHIPGTTAHAVTKTWIDSNNQDGIRPTEITVQLKANGVAYGEPVILTGTTGWIYEWANLPVNNNSVPITYTVEEVIVPGGYEVSYTEGEGITTLSNTHIPEIINKTVRKVWMDDNNSDGLRPSAIMVQLRANGVNTGDAVVLNEGNNWTYTWSGLAKYRNETEIVYTVEEVTIPDGYAVRYSADTFVITNIHTTTPDEPEVILYVNKVLRNPQGELIGNGKIFYLIVVDSNRNEVARVEVGANEGPVEIRGLRSGEIYTLAEMSGTLFTFRGFNINGEGLIERTFLTFRVTLSEGQLAGRVYITMNNEMDETDIDEDDPPLGDPEWPDPNDPIEIPPEEPPLGPPAEPPKTGDINIYPVILSTGLTLFAGVMLFGRKKKEKKVRN